LTASDDVQGADWILASRETLAPSSPRDSRRTPASSTRPGGVGAWIRP